MGGSIEITYRSIGILHTPFVDLARMPIQPGGEGGAPGYAEVFSEYVEGLADIDGFSHLILLYHLHKVSTCRLRVVPFLDTQERGLFSTRAPVRPNPIGISIVELTGVHANRLQFARLDVLDGTPLLDIKPYIPDFDGPTAVRTGWYGMASGSMRTTRSDERFA